MNSIFFHVATIGQYKHILSEIINCINISGLEDYADSINLGIVGTEHIEFKKNKYHILYQNSDISKYEFLTLKKMQEFCVNNPIGNVLYIHTKGASTQKNICIDDWRKYMSYFLITKYKECITFLDEYEAVGVDWRTDPVPHFSGNFWWAKASYIATLPDIEYLSRPDAPYVLSVRHNAEFWIGMNNPKVKILWDCGINQYNRHLYRYEPKNYEGKTYDT